MNETVWTVCCVQWINHILWRTLLIYIILHCRLLLFNIWCLDFSVQSEDSWTFVQWTVHLKHWTSFLSAIMKSMAEFLHLLVSFLLEFVWFPTEQILFIELSRMNNHFIWPMHKNIPTECNRSDCYLSRSKINIQRIELPVSKIFLCALQKYAHKRQESTNMRLTTETSW